MQQLFESGHSLIASMIAPQEVQPKIHHGTIIRKGIPCKKIPCYMRKLACRWFIVKKLKYFEVMLNIFEFLRVRENVKFVYANNLF